MSEIDNVLHAVDRSVAVLREDLEKSQQEAQRSEADFRSMRLRHERVEAELAKRTARNSDLLRELRQYHDAEPQRRADLDLINRMSLALYHLIVELSGHRDTAKTKAERIALGHVVERLKEIRPLNDAEKAEVGE